MEWALAALAIGGLFLLKRQTDYATAPIPTPPSSAPTFVVVTQLAGNATTPPAAQGGARPLPPAPGMGAVELSSGAVQGPSAEDSIIGAADSIEEQGANKVLPGLGTAVGAGLNLVNQLPIGSTGQSLVKDAVDPVHLAQAQVQAVVAVGSAVVSAVTSIGPGLDGLHTEESNHTALANLTAETGSVAGALQVIQTEQHPNPSPLVTVAEP